MNVFLASKKGTDKLCIGGVLADFFGALSQQVEWQHFEQAYAMLMLLVQFVIDETGSS